MLVLKKMEEPLSGHLIQYWCNSGARLLCALLSQLLMAPCLAWGSSQLGYQALLAGVQSEVVQSVVDSLDLPHLHKPDLDVFLAAISPGPCACGHWSAQHSVQVLQSLHHPTAISLLSLAWSGQGYKVARKPSQIFLTLLFNCSPWKCKR